MKVVRTSEKKHRTPLEGDITSVSLGNNNNKNKTLMNGHHIRFIASYTGKQPTDNEAKIVKLRGWNKHVWTRNNYKIVANLHCLEVTLEFDGGSYCSNVVEKVEHTRVIAERILKKFCAMHKLKLASSVELTKHSHWVLEHAGISKTLESLTYIDNEKVEAIYSDSSHPDKLEFIGEESLEGAKGIDYFTLTLPKNLEYMQKGQIAFRQDVKVLTGLFAEYFKRQDKIEKILVDILEKQK